MSRVAAYDLVVIGGSAAGVSTLEAARGYNSDATILLITAEDRLPYKRTKVSKSFATPVSHDSFQLHDASWYEEQGIEPRVGTRVERIDRRGRTCLLSDGTKIRYNALVLATGARPRPPITATGGEFDERTLHFAHSMADVERLRRAALDAESAIVVGTGVLGVEVTEQLVKLGVRVDLVGHDRRIMKRELNGEAFARLDALLREEGVAVHYNQSPEKLTSGTLGTGARRGVRLRTSSQELAGDLIVFCTGMQPDTRLAEAAGLRVNRGVIVDPYLKTSDPHIYAVGDVAEHPDARVTHLWRDALRQGAVAGRNVLGARGTYRYREFRLKCEVFGCYFFSIGYSGLSTRSDAMFVDEFDEADRYVAYYFDSTDALCAVVMVNDKGRQEEYMQAVNERWSRERVTSALGAVL